MAVSSHFSLVLVIFVEYYVQIAFSTGLYGAYVKCADGSSPQKDGNGQTIACTKGQSYTGCQLPYQCTTPLADRPGVCCNPGAYVQNTPDPPPATDVPPPPPPQATFSPPSPPGPSGILPPAGGQIGGAGGDFTDPPSVPPPPDSSGQIDGGAGGGGPVTSSPTNTPVDTPTPAVPVVTGGNGETTPPTNPVDSLATSTSLPSIIQSTTGSSVVVNTDGNGNAIVSPQSIPDDNSQPPPPFELMPPQSPPPPVRDVTRGSGTNTTTVGLFVSTPSNSSVQLASIQG